MCVQDDADADGGTRKRERGRERRRGRERGEREGEGGREREGERKREKEIGRGGGREKIGNENICIIRPNILALVPMHSQASFMNTFYRPRSPLLRSREIDAIQSAFTCAASSDPA